MTENKALRAQDYLLHIVAAIERIETYLQGFDLTGFIESTLVQDAVIRNIEIIGEAAGKIQAADSASTTRSYDSTSPTGCETR